MWHSISLLFLFLTATTTTVHGLVARTPPHLSQYGNTLGGGDGNNNNNGGDDQMNWEDLARILLTMQSAGVPDEVLMRRISIPNLTRVKIAPSTLEGAGRGLFATMDVKEGTLLSCYPGDVILRESGATGIPDELEADEPRLRHYIKSYSIGLTEDIGFMGLPQLDQDTAYASHFINDGGTPPTVEAEFDRYLEESRQKSNVYHVPLENLHMVTVAKRDIQAGEEIFAHYGPVYWMGQEATWKGGELDLSNF